MLARRLELPALLLEFSEESDILNGDHGLIGKGLEESDLLHRERSGLGASDGDRPNGVPFQ